MNYSYTIEARPAHLGGGWRLRLLEDGEEVGGGVFPLPDDDPQAGIAWWNALDIADRAYWIDRAESAVPADAWRAHLLDEAYSEAEDEGRAWVDILRA